MGSAHDRTDNSANERANRDVPGNHVLVHQSAARNGHQCADNGPNGQEREPQFEALALGLLATEFLEGLGRVLF